MDAKEEKKILRKKMKEKALGLGGEYCRYADQAIFRQVTSLPEYIESHVVFCYVGTEGEIDTRPLLLDAIKRGKQVCVPLCTGRGIMEARQIENLDSLRPGKFGILEPGREAPLVEPGQIELALIPCLSCTAQGKRLGYGGGYYDRYLGRMLGRRAVLCRERMMEEWIPEEPHDVGMDLVITERRIHRIGEM